MPFFSSLLPFASLPIVALLLCIVFVISCARLQKFGQSSSYRLPPGPRPLPIIGNLHCLRTLPHRDVAKLSRTYGPIMRLRLGSVSAIFISSPSLAEQVLKSNDIIFANRAPSEAGEFMSYGYKAIAFSEYGHYWRGVRKLCIAHLLAPAKINLCEFIRKEEVGNFVESCKEAAMARRVVDVTTKEIFGGAMDTTPIAIEWAFAELLRHPRAMKKAQEELERVVGLHRMVEESDLPKLPYLAMVVKESLRLHHLGPFLLHYTKQDFNLAGYDISKGSSVLVCSWAMGRDPNLWPDPEEFVPERFENSSVDVKGRDFQLLPFGSGRRGCPGMSYAMVVVSLVLAQLVHCFDWQLLGGMPPAELDMSEKFGLAMPRAVALHATPVYRLIGD